MMCTGLVVFNTKSYLGLDAVFLVFQGFWCTVAWGRANVQAYKKTHTVKEFWKKDFDWLKIKDGHYT
jgi:hypothetical protein